jgi:hypothetical protein
VGFDVITLQTGEASPAKLNPKLFNPAFLVYFSPFSPDKGFRDEVSNSSNYFPQILHPYTPPNRKY